MQHGSRVALSRVVFALLENRAQEFSLAAGALLSQHYAGFLVPVRVFVILLMG
jgi:hypothetical protein